MMLKKILQKVLAVFLVMLSTTALANKTDATANHIYTQDKQNIFITANHPEFTIQLKSNPTTGYSWFLREYDANLLTPVKHHFEAPHQTLMGAPGYEFWTFRVKAHGFVVPQQTTIRFVYTRPWAESSTQLVFRVSTGGNE